MPTGAIPFPFGDCRICNDKATGVHYGVATCEGCKGFFKRSTTKSEKYKCFFGGQCVLSPKNRNRCKACRYQKCLDLGMSMEAVKMGRIPKVDKERALEAHRQHIGSDATQIHNGDGTGPDRNCQPGVMGQSEHSINAHHQQLSYVHNQLPPKDLPPQHAPEGPQWMPPSSSVASSTQSQSMMTAMPVREHSGMSYGPTSDPPPPPPPQSLHQMQQPPHNQQSHLLMCPPQPHLPPDQFPHVPYSSHSPELPTAGFVQNYPQSGDCNQAQHRNSDRYRNESQRAMGYQAGQEVLDPVNGIVLKQEVQEDDKRQSCYGDATISVKRQISMPELGNRSETMSPPQSGSRPSSRSHYSTDVIRELMSQVIEYRQSSPASFINHFVSSLKMSPNQSQQLHLKEQHRLNSIHSNCEEQSLDMTLPVQNQSVQNVSGRNTMDHSQAPFWEPQFAQKRRASEGTGNDDMQSPPKKSPSGHVLEDEQKKELQKLVINLLLQDQDKGETFNALAQQLVEKLNSFASQNQSHMRETSSADCQQGMHAFSPEQSFSPRYQREIITQKDVALPPDCGSRYHRKSRVQDDTLSTSGDCTSRQTHAADSSLSSQVEIQAIAVDSGHAQEKVGNSSVQGVSESSPSSTCSKADCSTETSENLAMLVKTLDKLRQSDVKHNVLIRKFMAMMEDEVSGKKEPHELNQLTQATVSQAKILWTSLFDNIPATNKRIIGVCHEMPGFNALSQDDRSKLMDQSYFDLWMLSSAPLFKNGESYLRLPCGACYSRWWMNHFLPGDLVTTMFRFTDELNALKLNSIENLILCAIRLTDPDRSNLTKPDEVRVLNNHYWDVLAHEMQNSHGASSGRMLINIFRILPSLAPIQKMQHEITGNFRPDKLPDKAVGMLSEDNGDSFIPPSTICGTQNKTQEPTLPLST